MDNWRKVFGQKETPNKGFKRYETEGGEKLPNRAEFTGDKFPSKTGDSAKVEVDAFKEGNKLMGKDKDREDSSAEGGSALMSEKAKRSDVEKHMKTETDHTKPSYASWHKVLGEDLSFKQKPDGTLQIDVASHPNEPLVQNPVTELPAPVSPEEADQAVEAKIEKIAFTEGDTVQHVRSGQRGVVTQVVGNDVYVDLGDT